MRAFAILTGLVAALAVAPMASAATSVFGGKVPCAAQSSRGNVLLCSGPTRSFDGTKIDVNVILPATGVTGGPYPAIGLFHGWGGQKIGFDGGAEDWAKQGYAVFSPTDRGWGQSCGPGDPDRNNPSLCGRGYNHMMDNRFEVRDAQYLLSVLADERIVQPRAIGVSGSSFGGSLTMALAALRNRMVLPDGSYASWRSPGGQQMEIAAAVAVIPWTDLPYSLMPNGDTLDYVSPAAYMARGRFGVAKHSFVNSLLLSGARKSRYAPAGSDPSADLSNWRTTIIGGDPYEQNAAAWGMVSELTRNHSNYYINASVAPAPLLIASGFTDDFLPADEAIRFYNRTRTIYPGAHISLQFADYGHPRAQNKPADVAKLSYRRWRWLDGFIKGAGQPPFEGVEALTQTCPATAPSGGPYTAPSWAELAPGEIQEVSGPAQTILADGGGWASSGRAKTYDPVGGEGACARASGSNLPGVASYRFAHPGRSFTLMGSPTIIANIKSPTHSELAARLLDVAPNGSAVLVARGVYRPEITGSDPAIRQVFQLHPNGYRFAPDHTIKLELLPNDFPYAQKTPDQPTLTVSNLRLRLPVVERPDGGLIRPPAAKFMPQGYALASDFAAP